ncbi:putative membrane protein YeaQ/YmgE (transglycosylase-associated protein family) [Microbacterium sp. 1154]|uniref:hypothetical protein n=1 Tax=Microbacterium sp. 1154 TaxID=2817733 RepID=UPI000E22743E|nr:hypothetical protein [Microbacterium sp. 1154]MDR6691241.1 putative membrane protein YeaQ/YmgE (transglycosylase-associated protein family) [Microbacterium sp. 1154]
MQILLGLIIGAVIGLAVHFALPHRHLRGVVLAPLAGAAAAGIVWTALTWMGLGADSPILWIAAVLAPTLTTVVLVSLLTRSRVARDHADRVRLGV